MGTTVTQIAGGGRHSLALVPSGNKLYAFGYSIQGQLGRQTYKTSDIPQVFRKGQTIFIILSLMFFGLKNLILEFEKVGTNTQRLLFNQQL